MSSIMKGIVDESEEVAVIYIDNKPSTKYAKKHEAERDAEFLRKKYPNKKIEIKHEVRETEAKKGADGKRCWKGKRYAGTENGKDKCIPVKENDFDPKNREGWCIVHRDTGDLMDRRTFPSKENAEFWLGHAFDSKKHEVKRFDTMGEAANPAQQAAIAINMKKKGKKPKNVDEASGTPGGVEMFRTKDMVNTTMQQNLYRRELQAVKDAEKKAKRAAYRAANPREAVPMMHIGASSYQIPAIQAWKDNGDVGEAIKYAVNKFANKQSKEFKADLASDPNFKEAVINFFNVGADILAARNAAMAKRGGSVPDSDYRTKEQTEAGYSAINIINDVLLNHMKKHGVDKTGRRVPPGFNYALGEGVIVGHDANDPEVAILGGAGTMSLSRLKKKAHQEALQLADDIANGKYNASSYNMKQLHNTLNTIVAAEKEMEKLYFGESLDENAWNQLGQRKPNTNLPAPDRGSRVNHGRRFEEGDIVIPLSGPLKGQPHKVIHSQRSSIRIVPLGRDSYPGDTIAPRTKHEWVVPASEEQVAQARANAKAFADKVNNFNEDYTGEYAAEKTAAVNPYGGLKDRQFRGAISETPTDNPTGASGEGGWRTYKPKSAGEIEEGQIYSTGGGCGQSYRKFKPKSAGTFKESAIMKALKRESK